MLTFLLFCYFFFFFFQAEDGIRDLVRSRGLGDVYKRQELNGAYFLSSIAYERKHKWKHKQGNNTKSETINAELLVTEITVKNPQTIPSRAYYEEVPFDEKFWDCLLYTSDAADDLLCVDLGGRRIIKKKNNKELHERTLVVKHIMNIQDIEYDMRL
eukprot:TRINITY_DN13613_c0_g1_i1.p1 TRINITY_DN13613_c0_g1~~TRINITY_DN13613_c0_g1_i1.p1  ORF type:complete len:157 (+),score=45.82 TRINITY_DN13613_c0_g1_i1:88-558(+)